MPESEYMSESQLDFFRQRLLVMRDEVLARQVATLEYLNERETPADPADRATAEEEYTLALRLRERESMLLRKIDESLARIRNKDYGYCEKTGEPIGIPRLLARPTATVCVQVKDQDEKIEQHFVAR
jgi:DnaK suppressor protein